jgi:hypothetical protein
LKTDREFLDGMWDKVAQIEYEEMQNRAAKVRHKKIMLTNITIVLSIIIMFAFFIIAKPATDETLLYIISVILLTGAYWLDKFISGENHKKSKGTKLHEN